MSDELGNLEADSSEHGEAAPESTSSAKGRLVHEAERFHPSDFMRARHPNLFSDTKIIQRLHLERAVFDHHLSTLTSRKQELIFERFARRLAEKEVCPNLIPQTGPTGGGDSKVDTETYPVAEEIALRWYEGQTGAARERWGFAFSTKKAWKPKAKQDVAGIAATGRGYRHVYFVTSQYVKDKDRAATEDQLRELHGFDVHILDRTWIIEKVFANKREQLAIDTLELEPPLAPAIIKGPKDSHRETELDELEQEINDPSRYVGIEYQLVEDCLETVLLARGLERPRIEIDGRFDRARRVAAQYGTAQQQLRIAYNRAWTLFWWYEDYASFTAAYDDVEHLATSSSQAGDIELLKNLWQLLYAANSRRDINSDIAKLAQRTTTLKQHLRRLQDDASRPATALHARAEQLLMDLVGAPSSKDRDGVLSDFQALFERCQGLVDFPARPLIELITEIGTLFPADAAFDKMFETVIALAQERDSRQTAGRMLLHRGMQLLDHHQPYEAIRCLGRAQQLLALHECRDEFISALALSASAYETAGLLWAAYASMLLAASQALKEFAEDGTVTRQAFACVRRLTWLALQLGRVACVLAFAELAVALQHAIKFDETQKESLRDEWRNLDIALGVLLLRTEMFDLKGISGLAPTLDRFGLEFSWVALLYALGYEDKLRAENVFPKDETSDNVLAVFTRALTETEGDLPPKPELLDRRKLELRSSVLGCAVTLESPNIERSVFLAEAILASLEAFLATSLDAQLWPYASRLHLKLVPSDFLSKPMEWNVFDDQPLIEIRYGNEIADSAVYELLPELIITITMRLAIPSDLAHFETLFRDEQAMGRAMCIARTDVTTKNVLGADPKLGITDWQSDKNDEFPVRRTVPWNAGQGAGPKQTHLQPPIFATGDPPSDLVNVERLKHKDRRVVSLIDIPLWDKAGWHGAGFVEHPDDRVPPLMALIFSDRESGKKIFAGLRSELGTRDQAGRLRISIVTGIDRDNPAHYRIIVGPNVDWEAGGPNSHVVMVSRILTVEPGTSANLERFLSKYRTDGAYFLTPGNASPGATIPDFDPRLAIILTQLHVRPAWEISENDPDAIGIQAEDNVVIPEGVTDAPILRTLACIKKRRKYGKGEGPSNPTSGRKVGRNEPCPCGSGKKFKKCHGR